MMDSSSYCQCVRLLADAGQSGRAYGDTCRADGAQGRQVRRGVAVRVEVMADVTSQRLADPF